MSKQTKDASQCWGPHVGAVSLTFDDGRESQLTHAIPIMNDCGVRGTFYVSGPLNHDDWQERITPWVQVASDGHEIANHTMSHWCSCNLGFAKPGQSLEDKTLADIEADILTAQQRLEVVAPHQKLWTFAYPCSQPYVGRGRNQKSYVPIVAKHFLAGRCGGEFGFANCPAVADLHMLLSTDVSWRSGFEMIGLIEQLTAQGQWMILCFHEINGPRLSVSSYHFRMLLDYLKRRSETIWTAPVIEVAQKVAEFQARRCGRSD